MGSVPSPPPRVPHRVRVTRTKPYKEIPWIVRAAEQHNSVISSSLRSERERSPPQRGLTLLLNRRFSVSHPSRQEPIPHRGDNLGLACAKKHGILRAPTVRIALRLYKREAARSITERESNSFWSIFVFTSSRPGRCYGGRVWRGWRKVDTATARSAGAFAVTVAR